MRRVLSVATSTVLAFALVCLVCEGYFRLRSAPSRLLAMRQ